MGEEKFIENTSLIRYNNKIYEEKKYKNFEDIQFSDKTDTVEWMNTYSIDVKSIREVVLQNHLDDFINNLIGDTNYTTKVIELEKVIFISLKVMRTKEESLNSEQMFFILTPELLWSIQERKGDYFEWIRERLRINKGVVRNKKSDYLLFLMLDSIIENYELTFQHLAETNDNLFLGITADPSPDFIRLIEHRKQLLFRCNKATKGLRDILIKLEKIESVRIKAKYINELKDQCINLISDIDFELQELESKINLVFTIQGHRLNEVMKILTIFSVIFIPLTFIAGIYGMNFVHMPELQSSYGYFIVLVVMALLALGIIYYFKRKEWF